MYWQDKTKDTYGVPDQIQDLVFRIQGRDLPLDHAHALSSAIKNEIPWITTQPDSGIHLIHVAESGNGWYRPEDIDGEVLHLSRRTRMTLRVPKTHIDAATVLCGRELNINGHLLKVGTATPKLLSALPTQFARHVITEQAEDEDMFMQRTIKSLAELEIRVPKMLCGRLHSFTLPTGTVRVRSLLLADLEPPDAVRVQQRGLGTGRLLGCGLFLPHKGLDAVNAGAD